MSISKRWEPDVIYELRVWTEPRKGGETKYSLEAVSRDGQPPLLIAQRTSVEPPEVAIRKMLRDAVADA